MTTIGALLKASAIPVVALGLAAAACFLPDDPYQRWQLLDGTIHGRVRWMYERSHFDPKPIDVAIIGPSRSAEGIIAPRLGQALAARGLPANVVNFSVNDVGRNLNYAITLQMFEKKKPRLLIIAITEAPPRRGHKAFRFVAPANIVLDSGYIGNLNYLSDLSYLPYRQIELSVADMFPDLIGLRKEFDAKEYLGSDLDTTGAQTLGNGRVVMRDTAAPIDELRKKAKEAKRELRPDILPARYAEIEYGDERHYVRAIVQLANAHHAQVVFVFIPMYSGPVQVRDEAFYLKYGPVWNAGFVATQPEWYRDFAHLDGTGARVLTDWLAERVEQSSYEQSQTAVLR